MQRSSVDISIPDGWQRVQLGDVADVAFSGVDKRTVDGEIPVHLCNYTDVFYNRRIVAGMDLMTATATLSEKDKWALRNGDVIFTKDSETPDEIGIPAFVADDMPGVLCGYHLGLARPRRDAVDGAFLAKALTSNESRKQFARIANGVTRFGLTLDATKALPILLPPLPEQRAIAAVLDSIDDAIEGAEAAIAATEGLRDSLLHDLLTRGFPGQHTEFRDVPGLGTIPADWEVVRLGDVVEEGPTNGIYKPDSEYGSGVGLIRIDDFGFGEFANFGDFQRIRATGEEIRRFEIKEGDIVINRVNSLSHIGKSVLIPRVNEPTLFESNMMRLRLGKAVDSGFGALVLLSDNTRHYFKARAKKAVQQASINQQDVSQLPFPLPTLAEQQAIVAALDGVDTAMEVAREELAGLRLLKESTADALLTGRVRAVKPTALEGSG